MHNTGHPLTEAVNDRVKKTGKPGKPARKEVLFIPFLAENPYQSMLCSALGKLDINVKGANSVRRVPLFGKHSPDAIHLHWLPRFQQGLRESIKLHAFYLRLFLLKCFGKKIVWTAHNLFSHDAETVHRERVLTRGVLAAATGVIVHSPIAISLVRDEFSVRRPGKIVSIPHGNYMPCYRNDIQHACARRQLELNDDSTVFLFLGNIRPYKGVNELVNAFGSIPGSDVRLLIAGKAFNDADMRTLEQRVEKDPRIVMHAGFIADDELQVYFNAADVVVYPYRNILTSGAVVLGMSFAKACIAPSIGCIPDYLDTNGAFLYDPGDPSGLVSAIEQARANKARLAGMGQHNFKKAEAWNWDLIASRTAELY